MSLHLVAEDHSEDPLEPIVCRFCGGEQTLPVVDIRVIPAVQTGSLPCPGCCCSTCGEPTSTPPQCRDCAEAQADDEAAKAYREGRYE